MGNQQLKSSPELEIDENDPGRYAPIRIQNAPRTHQRENDDFINVGYNNHGRGGFSTSSPSNVYANAFVQRQDELRQPGTDSLPSQRKYVYHQYVGQDEHPEDNSSLISPESEVDIPIYDDDDHSSPITVLHFDINQNMNRRKLPSWVETSPIEEVPVYTGSTAGSRDLSEEASNSGYHYRKETPQKYFTYIDMDKQTAFVSNDSDSIVQDNDGDSTPENVDEETSVLVDNAIDEKSLSSASEDPETIIRGSLISSNSIHSGTRRHSLPPVAFERVKNCLSSLPLDEGQTISESAIERVASHIKIIDYVAKTDVLIKGEEASGIFIIISGTVNVVSENGTEVLATLQDGEYFGEISVLFHCPCTARVQTVTKCQFALLEVNDARRLFHKVNVDIIDYFVYKRYLPTSDHMDVTRTQRRMVLTCLRMLPVFEHWSLDAIKALILQIQPALVILYQANTVIVQEKDPPVALYVIIRGRAVIKSEDQIIVETYADKHPVVIGEECIHLGCKSSVTIQTSTCCQVVLIKQEYIQNVLSEFAVDASDVWYERQRGWKAMGGKTDLLHQRFPHLLQFEVLYHLVINHPIFSWCSPQCVQYIVLQGAPSYYNLGQVVCSQIEYEDSKVVLVVKGTVELLTKPDLRYAVNMDAGDIFYRCKWMGTRGKLIARSECLVYKIDKKDVVDALEEFKDCHLVLPTKPE